MTIQIDIADTNLDESPPTIAYMILAMCAHTYDFEVGVEWSLGEEYISIRDNDTGIVHFQVAVSPMMGRMLVSILEQTGEEITGTVEEW